MKRLTRATLLAAMILAAFAQSAEAHQGNPNFRSIVHGLSPREPGLSVQVIGTDAFMQLTNHSGKQVVIYGYDGEPYARLLPDGTVQTNQRSPALYLNEDRYAQVKVPSNADAKAPPEWKTLDGSGQFTWHDHRMHWMSQTTPPQVKDKNKKTRVFNYKIPLRVAGKPDKIDGTLFWVGSPHGFPVAAIVSLALIALLAAGGIAYLRRRRGDQNDGGSRAAPEEAW